LKILMRRWVRLTAIVALTAAGATAERYRFRTYGPDEGLNTSVTRILQDRAGFLWVGTGNGLFRFDGARFQRFGTDDGLPSQSIRCLHETADGVLWIVTGRGLVRRVRNTFQPVDTKISRDDTDFRAIDSDSTGRIYVGSDGGLLVSDPVQSQETPTFHLLAGAARDPVNGVYVDPGHGVWFSSGLQLYLMENGRFTAFGEAQGLPPEHWGAMLRDKNGNLWVRGGRYLYVRPAGSQRFIARDHGLPQSSNTILTLLMDRFGTVMVSTDLGVARWINGDWKLTGSAQGLGSDTVTALYPDREGSLWIGLWGIGVVRWPAYEQWSNWTTVDGLANNIVWAIRRHPSGSLWIGTDHGLQRMDGNRFTRTWKHGDGLAGDKVKALEAGPDGAMWAACLPGGISRIDPLTGKVRIYGARAGLSDDHVISLHFDREKRLWASTQEGLFRSTAFGPDLHFERLTPPGAQEHTTYFRFLEDRAGQIWVTSSQGLFRCDRGHWTRFTTRDGLRANFTTHVAEAADGAIWIAYREPVGVSRLTFTPAGIQVHHFSKKDGIPSDYILFLGLDAGKKMWVGTDVGVAVQSSRGWSVYTHENGLGWDDCAAAALLTEADGAVWIGSLNGLSRFLPSATPVEHTTPPVAITSVRFRNRVSDPGVFSKVRFADRDFSVAFASLRYIQNKAMRFRYRVVGLDDTWIETGLREARYSSLPAGTYRFEVAAQDPEGAWSIAPATVSFQIVAPWWQSWWFRAAALAALARLLVLAFRIRVKQMVGEQLRLAVAVRERTRELELQKNVVERQKLEIEELLRRTQEVSRLKSEFLANMSHEIRTPMNGVIGMTQLALNTPLDQEQREYITVVRDSAEALLVIINDILDFSKIEAGRMELTQDPFDLRKCVADALQVFAQTAADKNIPLVLEVAPEVPRVVVGDGGRLRQIILNLVGNALKFTERGQIAVRVEKEPRSSGKPGTMLRFAVQDTGMGIPSEKQAMIFEAFVQADGSMRRKQGGTGLGLAICSKLVRLMHGEIRVQSTPGLGSTFFFTAPFAHADNAPQISSDAAATRNTQPPAASRTLRILLAEDNSVNQLVAQRAIERLGHSVEVADNGRKAVDLVACMPFDLIFMDVQMPEMDGFEATARIREQERLAVSTKPARHTPIVAMTAHTMSGDRELCLQAGMDDYISKPIHLKELNELIARLASYSEPAPADTGGPEGAADRAYTNGTE
jgi:signal transduction histidine kinase/ligand-binding sensor domain-containing protein/CheY-like chemotaxis protein